MKNLLCSASLSIFDYFYDFFVDLKISIRDNSCLGYISATYYLSTFIIGILIGKRITGNLLFYYVKLYDFAISFFIFSFCVVLVYVLAKNIRSGFSAFSLIWPKFKTLFFTSKKLSNFLVIFCFIPPFMCSYSSIKQIIPLLNQFRFDLLFFKIDKILHFNHSPWEIIQPYLGHPAITKFFDYCYALWGVIFIFSLLFMAHQSDRRLRLQFFISLAFSWILIGNILACFLSSAGPCFFSQVTGVAVNPYAPLFNYLGNIPGLWAANIQTSLWDAYQAGLFMPLGGISAMPSMHVSIAVLLALQARRFSRWSKWLLLGYAIIIQIGSVHLGWHYAIDGYISAILTILIWKSTGHLISRNEPYLTQLDRAGFS